MRESCGARELDVEFDDRKREREREKEGEKVTVACRRVLNALVRDCPCGLWPTAVAPANGKSPSRLSSGPSSFFLACLFLRCVVSFPSSSTTPTLSRAFRERYRFARESHSVDSSTEEAKWNEDG